MHKDTSLSDFSARGIRQSPSQKYLHHSFVQAGPRASPLGHFNFMSPPDYENVDLRKSTIDPIDYYNVPISSDLGSHTSRKTQFKLQKVLEAYNRQKELRSVSKLS